MLVLALGKSGWLLVGEEEHVFDVEKGATRLGLLEKQNRQVQSMSSFWFTHFQKTQPNPTAAGGSAAGAPAARCRYAAAPGGASAALGADLGEIV